MSTSDGEKPMDETNGAGQPGTPCCGGGAKQACESGGSTEACGCGSAPTRSWIKTLIASVVILAALAVSAYSLIASPNAKPSAAAVAPSSPTTGATSKPSTCCGSAGAEAAPQPTCCGAAASAAPSEQPTCGEAAKGCCGH
jgi:hypothetical protein